MCWTPSNTATNLTALSVSINAIAGKTFAANPWKMCTIQTQTQTQANRANLSNTALVWPIMTNSFVSFVSFVGRRTECFLKRVPTTIGPTPGSFILSAALLALFGVDVREEFQDIMVDQRR